MKPKINISSYNDDTDFTGYGFSPYNYRIYAKVRPSRVAARVKVILDGLVVKIVLARVEDPDDMPAKIRRVAKKILYRAIRDL